MPSAADAAADTARPGDQLRLLEQLVVDPARMRENSRDLEGDLGAAGLLIDRVLLTHERAPR